MKQYIVIRHNDGLFKTIDKQFDKAEDAVNYIRLAQLGDSSVTYELYERTSCICLAP